MSESTRARPSPLPDEEEWVANAIEAATERYATGEWSLQTHEEAVESALAPDIDASEWRNEYGVAMTELFPSLLDGRAVYR